MNEMITLKMNILGGMHEYVMNQIGDEDLIDYWLREGVCDCPDEDFLEFCASNEETFANICAVFGKIVKASVE